MKTRQQTDSRKSTIIGVRLRESDVKALDAARQKMGGITRSDFIRMAVRQMVRKETRK